MNKRLLALIGCLAMVLNLFAAKVDTLWVKSEKMKKSIKVVVIIPDRKPAEGFPVFYLLHGYSGNEKTWLGIKPDLPQMAEKDQLMVVCPAGGNSWYWDSPTHTDSQYETFIANELIQYIDTHYPTRADRKYRCISGLSMGGHGGMWLGIRHKDVFGAAGSMSGGLDIRPFPDNWEMKNQLGEKNQYPDRWDAFTVINQLDRLQNGDLAILIDCGAQDFFLNVNKQFHEALLQRGIQHDFIIRPGHHDSLYWQNAFDYQWLFMKKFFNGYRSPI